jgi:tRNA(adenine34) deaminase
MQACAAAACHVALPGRAAELDAPQGLFVAEAQRMKELAIAAGDQHYGAIVVRDGKIVGYGPSRVVVDRNPDAHAERVALKDAQQRLGTADLAGAALYSTSRPCPACESAAAQAGLDRMFFGPSAADAGPPRRF